MVLESLISYFTFSVMSVQATWERTDEHGSTTYIVVSHNNQSKETHEQGFCLALTDENKRVFLLGSESCSRRRVSNNFKMDFYLEGTCPPPGTSVASHRSSFVLAVLGAVVAVLALRTIQDSGL